MSKLEIKRDIEDNQHLIFTNPNLNKGQIIGNKIEDFEILMLLGEGGFGKVFKVRSKLNNNIYAMKIVDLKKVEKEQGVHSKELAYREVQLLPAISHSHIIKYYHYFEKDSFLYILTEYIRNGDMSDLIDIRRELKIPFKEEELWDIFYQCINSLCYIHEKGVIHRDIKPLNIFIDDNMKIKIGDFGISALNPSQYKIHKFEYSKGTYINPKDDKNDDLLSHNTVLGTQGFQAKEMQENGEYDQKIDVYAMGCTFFELVYLHSPLINSEEDQNVKKQYSDKIFEIISLMRQDNKDKRYNSFQANEYIEKEYLKISKNSSIFSLITCLSSLKDLNNSLDMNRPFNNSYKAFLGFLSERKQKSDEGWKNFIKRFREALSERNLKFEGINEIKPSFLFAFIIEKLYEEYEETRNKKIVRQNFKDGSHLINSVDDYEIRNEGEARINFDKYFEENNSPIITNFRGLIKQTNICNKCNFITYSFSSYFFANFDLNEISKKKSITIFDFEDNLKTESNKILYCSKCLKKYEHNCKREYYTFPNLLVISIKRGTKTINQTEVNLKEFLELKDLDKKDGCQKKYQLVGLIKKISKTEGKDEQYYSNFYIDNKWFNYEKKETIYESHPPFEKTKATKNKELHGGDIVMLFYILKSK